MGKQKKTTVFNIIGNGTRIYFQNFFTLSTPLLFPTIGILIGLFLMIIPLVLIPKNIDAIINIAPFFADIIPYMILLLVSVVPGFIVFKLSFWDYMLKLVSVNVMIGDILKKKQLKHSSQYTSLIALRTKDYILMLLIWLLIILMGLALPFAILLYDVEPLFLPYVLVGLEFLAIFLLAVLSVYLGVSFQVFGFETDLGPMQTLERAFKLSLNNFWKLISLIISITIITYLIVPQVFVFLADMMMLKPILALPFEKLIGFALSSNHQIFDILTAMNLIAYGSETKFIYELSVKSSITLISSVIGLIMMPLGACYYTLFYFDAKKRIDVNKDAETELITAKKANKSPAKSGKKNKDV